MRSAALFFFLAACGGGNAVTTPPSTTGTLPAASAPKTYAVRLSHPSRVGEKLHVVADKTEEKATKVTAGDAVIDDKHERRVLHLDAISTVLEVNAAGRATKTREDVSELTINGKSVVKGAVEIVRAPKENDAIITVDGKPASDDARDALKSMLKLSSGGPTDDDVFGTKTAQAVGAHWAVDTQLAHDDLRDDTGLDASKVTGDVWLEGVTTAAGKDALDVRAKLGLEGLTPPGIPPGSTVEQGRADVDLQTTLPVDGQPERASERMSTAITFRLRVKTARGPALVAVTVSEKRDAKFSLP
jgi:hypothetical protein